MCSSSQAGAPSTSRTARCRPTTPALSASRRPRRAGGRRADRHVDDRLRMRASRRRGSRRWWRATAGGRAARSGCRAALTTAIHAHHRTQEEDLVSNWLVTETDGGGDMGALFQTACGGQWGMCRRRPHVPHGAARRLRARRRRRPRHLPRATFCHCVGGARLHAERDDDVGVGRPPVRPRARTRPRSSPPGRTRRREPRRSRRRRCGGRTARRRAQLSLLPRGRQVGAARVLDAAARQGYVALLAAVSCGLYAGPHKERIGACRRLSTNCSSSPCRRTASARPLLERVVTRARRTDTVGATPRRAPPRLPATRGLYLAARVAANSVLWGFRGRSVILYQSPAAAPHRNGSPSARPRRAAAAAPRAAAAAGRSPRAPRAARAAPAPAARAAAAVAAARAPAPAHRPPAPSA